MQLNKVEKLYKKLRPEQAAAMAFEAACRHDDKELNAVVDSQPRFNFTAPCRAYRNRVMELNRLAMFYGAVYWKTQAYILRAMHLRDEDAVIKTAVLLGSMEQALKETCRLFLVDVVTVKELGFCDHEDLYIEYADPSLTAEYVKLFTTAGH